MTDTPQDRPLEVACPQCRTKVAWTTDNPYRPFCSKRCRLLDLGAWADESHRIAGEPAMDEADLDRLIDGLERGESS
ncbi:MULTISPECIES: DNA gyrase inhibitor YacG [Chromohalobacter]|uniref:DNA gyrase inhibitor YacG n=1 Tax=Chromohalobacter TaxID=42054 RepID=UPI000553BE62|nr:MULTISPECIES: DNA gyrase inhibitor YacG [Chromohalobacter]MBZ5874701.1 DNA gyrase inhibitor YacG [Chromohalobacter salexigens]MDF9433506.1 DNA gyrase inhibitor YacG [Chromohalobacter israelensis]MDO0946326.1 DNA gyrase inhibitor YacG [Chromohalobacter salexigens]NQY46122.1 DNA gyrase inhibitor YacG [Chromohalobacter sp.]NWO56931.1 DNA gyrase inhibitor YacG [Chromohalobacter salexigens]